MELEQLLSSELLEWVNDTEDEQNVDSLLLAASQQFESQTDSTHNALPTKAASTHRAGLFAPPKCDANLQRAREKAVPKKQSRIPSSA